MASRKRADPRFRIVAIYPSVNRGKINKTISKRNSLPNTTQKTKELGTGTPPTTRMNSCVPEWYVVPTLLVESAVLRMLEMR